MTLDAAHKQASRCAPEDLQQPVLLAGRVVTETARGKSRLVILRDGSGDTCRTEFTALIDADALDAGRSPERWDEDVRPGDHVSVRGVLVSTHDGPILRVRTWAVLSRVTRCSEHTAAVHHLASEHLIQRAKLLTSLRNTLDRENFLEVETPMLEPADSQAAEQPFLTECRSLATSLCLRTSAELYLKRLVAAGYDRVFELARSFRDERPDATHNIEYTLLEVYRAYDDYAGMRHLARDLIRAAACVVLETSVITGPDEVSIDLEDDWPETPFYAAVSAAVGETLTPESEPTRARALALEHGVRAGKETTTDHVAMRLYERLVEPKTVRPTFYIDFPSQLSPLARPHPSNPKLAQKWDLVIFGREIAAACTEVVDIQEQIAQLQDQHPAAAPDVKFVGAAYLRALEHGAPPTAGLVVGIDRLAMTLTGLNDIRQVRPFLSAVPT